MLQRATKQSSNQVDLRLFETKDTRPNELERDEQGVLRHWSCRLHRLLAREEAPGPRMRRPCNPTKPRYVLARRAERLGISQVFVHFHHPSSLYCRGREQDRAAAGFPRRGGAAGAVRGGHLRRRQLPAGHRWLRVRLPRRRTNVATARCPQQLQGTSKIILLTQLRPCLVSQLFTNLAH